LTLQKRAKSPEPAVAEAPTPATPHRVTAPAADAGSGEQITPKAQAGHSSVLVDGQAASDLLLDAVSLFVAQQAEAGGLWEKHVAQVQEFFDRMQALMRGGDGVSG